jgi:heterodisulfide reductase subunit A
MKETQVTEGSAPREGEVRPRIGVFLCDCGSNIASTIDTASVAAHVAGLDDVALVERSSWICSTSFQETIKEKIKTGELNRVVVAACTPRTHAYLFRRTCETAGLNRYLFEFANVREQCSWVHREQRGEATAKARDLVAMAIAKARLLKPLADAKLEVGTRALVVGGGIAGLTAAETLAGFGFEVVVVEKERELGGVVRRLASLHGPDDGATDVLAEKIAAIAGDPQIRVLTSTCVRAVKGHLGDFRISIERQGETSEIQAATIVVATGFQESAKQEALRALGLPADFDGAVLTQLELEEKLRAGTFPPCSRIVIVNCFGGGEVPPCGVCRIGCGVAFKNARRLVDLLPDARVHVLTREVMTPGLEERTLALLRHPRLKVIRYPHERPPVVTPEKGSLTVAVRDEALGEEMSIGADLVVLTPPFEGDPGNVPLAQALKIPLGSARFFQEAHVKLKPLETMVEGVYLAGCAQGPKWAAEAIQSGVGAAFKAAQPMLKGVHVREAFYGVVDPQDCDGCGVCDRVCPVGAVELVKKKEASVVPGLCTGCGICAADCPRDAITMNAFEDEQILAQIDTALEHGAGRKILAFLCNWCSDVAADTAGVSRLQYSSAVRVVRVMCSGRVDRSFVLRALERGAGMVLVAGCRFGDCHYVDGNHRCSRRMEKLGWALEKQGIPPDVLRVEWFASTEGQRFAEVMNEMQAALERRDSGASPRPEITR